MLNTAMRAGRDAQESTLPGAGLTYVQTAAHYVTATQVVQELPAFGWYDSHFLARFEAARRMLERTNPGAIDAFVAAFEPLRTDQSFSVKHLPKLLDQARFDELLGIVQALPAAMLKGYEAAEFGRGIVHDLPVLSTLQQELTPLVASLAGEAVEPSYNFLSLYNGDGRCPPHMDAPSAKWTLDLCLAQSCAWPIHFSDIVPWPTASSAAHLPDRLDPANLGVDFTAHVLQPNDALLFSGSSQWHYRDAIPDGGFCHLAFLHYRPVGSGPLVKPSRWAEHFGLPELAVLNTVFEALRPDART